LTTTPADGEDGEDGTFHRILTSDGLPLATWHLPPFFSGAAVQKQTAATPRTQIELLFAHATGFCGACWRPVRSGLGDFASTIFDFRGHGSSHSDRDLRSWWEMAQDVLAVTGRMSSAGEEPPALVGIGHSMGGAAVVMAELLNPGSFAAFVLVEPIIYGPPHTRDPNHPLVSLALKRRDRFESRAAVRAAYGEKPPFSAWHPDALDGYVSGGFVEEGEVARLACRPRSEAEVFTAAGIHAAWERLSEVSVPTTILYGADTETYLPGHAETLAGRFQDASALAVEQTGHFLPMERPEVVVRAVLDRVARLN
jgi:pimeloyl-ACP methyl ester carboxylesterase